MYFMCLTIKWCLTLSDNLVCSHFDAFYLSTLSIPFWLFSPAYGASAAFTWPTVRPRPEPDLTTVSRGAVCALSVTLLLWWQGARGLLDAVSRHRLFCVLSRFFKVIVEDGIDNHFWFSGSFLDKKRLHLASGIKTQDWRGHLPPFTSGGGPVSEPSQCPAPTSLACWILHLAHKNARALKEAASYCYFLRTCYPSKCLERRGWSKENSASVLERRCSYFIFLASVFSSSR